MIQLKSSLHWFIALFVLVLIWGKSSFVCSEEPHPLVEIELVSNEVYVGETPRVKITLTAPEEDDLFIVKANRASKRKSIQLDLIDPDGNSVPGGPPHFRAWKTEEDFLTLESGKSVNMEFEVLRPRVSGNYIVRVWLTPTPDDSFRVEKDLALVCIDIPALDIVSKVFVNVPKNIRKSSEELAELMNVKTENKFELIFRTSNLDGTYPKLERLLELDKNSEVLSITPKNFEPETWYEPHQLIVVYTLGNKTYSVSPLYSTGQLLEEPTVINEILVPPDLDVSPTDDPDPTNNFNNMPWLILVVVALVVALVAVMVAIDRVRQARG